MTRPPHSYESPVLAPRASRPARSVSSDRQPVTKPAGMIPFPRLEQLVAANATPTRIARCLFTALAANDESYRHARKAAYSPAIPLGSLKSHLETLGSEEADKFLYRIWRDALRFVGPAAQKRYRTRLLEHRSIVAVRPYSSSNKRLVHLEMLNEALSGKCSPGGFRIPAEELWASTGIGLSTIKELRLKLVAEREFVRVDHDETGMRPDRFRVKFPRSSYLPQSSCFFASLKQDMWGRNYGGNDNERMSLKLESLTTYLGSTRLDEFLDLRAHPAFDPQALTPFAHHVFALLLALDQRVTTADLVVLTSRPAEPVRAAHRSLRAANLVQSHHRLGHVATTEPFEALLDAVAELAGTFELRDDRIAYRAERQAVRNVERSKRRAVWARNKAAVRRAVIECRELEDWEELGSVEGEEMGAKKKEIWRRELAADVIDIAREALVIEARRAGPSKVGEDSPLHWREEDLYRVARESIEQCWLREMEDPWLGQLLDSTRQQINIEVF